jgi:hypothetical protein
MSACESVRRTRARKRASEMARRTWPSIVGGRPDRRSDLRRSSDRRRCLRRDRMRSLRSLSSPQRGAVRRRLQPVRCAALGEAASMAPSPECALRSMDMVSSPRVRIRKPAPARARGARVDANISVSGPDGGRRRLAAVLHPASAAFPQVVHTSNRTPKRTLRVQTCRSGGHRPESLSRGISPIAAASIFPAAPASARTSRLRHRHDPESDPVRSRERRHERRADVREHRAQQRRRRRRSIASSRGAHDELVRAQRTASEAPTGRRSGPSKSGAGVRRRAVQRRAVQRGAVSRGAVSRRAGWRRAVAHRAPPRRAAAGCALAPRRFRALPRGFARIATPVLDADIPHRVGVEPDRASFRAPHRSKRLLIPHPA